MILVVLVVLLVLSLLSLSSSLIPSLLQSSAIRAKLINKINTFNMVSTTIDDIDSNDSDNEATYGLANTTTTDDDNDDDDASASSNLYVILSNLQSGSNIGSICRNALAFNVREVIIVGRKSYKEKMRGADRGAKLKLKFNVFNSIKDATTYLKTSYNATIVGVEITSDASSLLTKDFTSNKATAFIFGNEGGGLSDRQRDACDEFVYIPQYRAGIHHRHHRYFYYNYNYHRNGISERCLLFSYRAELLCF